MYLYNNEENTYQYVFFIILAPTIKGRSFLIFRKSIL